MHYTYRVITSTQDGHSNRSRKAISQICKSGHTVINQSWKYRDHFNRAVSGGMWQTDLGSIIMHQVKEILSCELWATQYSQVMKRNAN